MFGPCANEGTCKSAIETVSIRSCKPGLADNHQPSPQHVGRWSVSSLLSCGRRGASFCGFIFIALFAAARATCQTGDGYQHVIVATASGDVNEVFFKGGGQPVGEDRLSHFTGVVGVAGYFGAVDKYQHVIVASSNGDVNEVYFRGGGQPIAEDLLTHFDGIVSVAGYFGAGDNYQHVIVASRDGTVNEVYFRGNGQGVNKDVLATFNNPVVALAGYFAQSDQYQHVIVATANGIITEVYFRGNGREIRQDTLAHIPGVIAVAGYFAPSDGYQHVIVATADGAISEVYFKGNGQVVTQVVLARLPGSVSLSAYYATSDRYQHVIVANTNGDVNELFFKGGGQPIGQDRLTRFDRIVGLAGYFGGADSTAVREHQIASVGPRYNEVFRKATHNSYWVSGSQSPSDFFAAGPRQRVLDQALYEHVRAFEFDLHFKSGKDGEFDVYHTDNQDNSTCYSLEDCLDLMRRIDYVLPNHEPINIILEFKEAVLHLFGDIPLQDHHPADIDRLLWERLGSRLYTPREFLERCASGLTLRECAAQKGWPTVSELRGRYIVNVIGANTPGWGYFNGDAYETYAKDDGGVINRAAFPLRSVFTHERDDPNTCLQVCALIRASEIFWQVEDISKPDVSAFLGDAGVIRSTAAHMIEDPVPGGNIDDIGKISQRTGMANGYQILMTDYPWNFINDARHAVTPSHDSPSSTNRAFFEAADVSPGTTRKWPAAALTEPGSRIYFNTANRFNESDRLGFGSGTREHDPTKSGYAEAFLELSESNPEQQLSETWEVFPSTTMITHGAGPENDGLSGAGCFFARSLDRRSELQVCRIAENNDGRDVGVKVTLSVNGKTVYQHLAQVHKNVTGDEPLGGGPIGDAFRIVLTRNLGQRVTTIRVMTANAVDPSGSMAWVNHPIQNTMGRGADFKVEALLSRQGLSQQNDGVFTGTKLNGHDVPLTQLHVTGNYVLDQSWCANGSCLSGMPLSHVSIHISKSGQPFIGVHETSGKVFGQWRTLYTTDRFELTTSGLYQVQVTNKFLVSQKDPGIGNAYAALYRCVDWRRNYHQHWLSTDPACANPNTKEAFARNAGQIGYLATVQLPGTQPLWHLRLGTHNNASGDTHDHYFAVGDAQRDVKINAGYSLVGVQPVGYVYTPSSLP